MTVKALVSQAQAITCTSLQLVQATFHIAACEHISSRPEVAYISVVSCIGMARILGVGETPIDISRAAVGNCGSRSMDGDGERGVGYCDAGEVRAIAEIIWICY